MTTVNHLSRTNSFSRPSNSEVSVDHSLSSGDRLVPSKLFVAQLNDESSPIPTSPINLSSPKSLSAAASHPILLNHQQVTSTTNVIHISVTIEQNNAKIIHEFVNAQSNFDKTKFHTFLQCTPSQETKINIFHLEELNSIEKLACHKKDSKTKILIKESKILILKNIEDQLKTTLGKKIDGIPAEEKKPNKFIRYLKYTSFAFMTIMGTLIGGVSSFLGMQGLLKMIFVGITAPVSLGIGLVLTIVESLMFFSFEVGMLKTAMGIDHRSDIKKCLDLDEIEISHINSIQTLLPQIAVRATKSELEYYNIIRKACNDSIESIKYSYTKEVKENKIQKAGRHTITAVGAVLVAAGTYYMMTSLVVFLSTLFLMSNPIGWSIIGIGILTSLAFFFSMRGKAVVNMFVPEIMQFKVLKIKVDKLEEQTIELCNLHQALLDENERLKGEIFRLKNNNAGNKFAFKRSHSFSC